MKKLHILAAVLLGGCSFNAKEPAKRTAESVPPAAQAPYPAALALPAVYLLPSGFTAKALTLGMPSDELREAYPASSTSTIVADLVAMTLAPAATRPVSDLGSVAYTPTTYVYQDRLVGVQILMTFMGKTNKSLLGAAEFRRLQSEMRAECERKYGPPTESARGPDEFGPDTIKYTWNKGSYTAALTLPAAKKEAEMFAVLGTLSSGIYTRPRATSARR